MHVVPDLLQFIALRARLENLDGVPIISLNDVPLRGFNSVLKRAIDVAHLGERAARARRSRSRHHRAAHQAHVAGPGVLHARSAWASTARRSTVYKFRSMYRRRRGRDRPDLGARRRPALHAGRPLAAPLRPRRAAAALERAARRHVDRRPAARAAVLRRAVQAPHPAVHAAPQGEGRHHRLGAGQRLARQHVAREAHRVRPLLHRELVGRPRHQDHVADAGARLCQKHAY